MGFFKKILPYLILAAIVAPVSYFIDTFDRTYAAIKTDSSVHAEKRAVYYWKTVLDLDSGELAYLKKHDIHRIYLRMFDVSVNSSEASRDLTYRVVPNATVNIRQSRYIMEDLDSLEFVPTIYITLAALKEAAGQEGTLAENIVERVKNMCKYHELPGVEALQLDCDWTVSTRKSFYALCDSVSMKIREKGLPWSLSSTIRLHQLRQTPPPVDYGVLMVYNTGSFNDPDATNSIISRSDVEPYLKYISDYPLHLDVAYPTYSWQLLFRNGQFVGLLNDLDTTNPDLFAPRINNSFVALADVPFRSTIIRKGDIIRCEMSDFREISSIMGLIEKKLSGKPHSNIIYHFDLKNLSNYSDNEIDSILSSPANI